MHRECLVVCLSLFASSSSVGVGFRTGIVVIRSTPCLYLISAVPVRRGGYANEAKQEFALLPIANGVSCVLRSVARSQACMSESASPVSPESRNGSAPCGRPYMLTTKVVMRVISSETRGGRRAVSPVSPVSASSVVSCFCQEGRAPTRRVARRVASPAPLRDGRRRAVDGGSETDVRASGDARGFRWCCGLCEHGRLIRVAMLSKDSTAQR